LEITNAIYDEGNPTGIKALLEHLNICGSDLRLPAMKATPALSQKLLQLLKNIPS
jgi:4-hydroxy-tetrahydrodipicolinate synthase